MLSMVSTLVHASMPNIWFLWSNSSLSVDLLYFIWHLSFLLTHRPLDFIRLTSQYVRYFTDKPSYFALSLGINSARRYYGIIRTLSIVNRTTYIYGMDTLCNQYAMTRNCFTITTSTSVINLATTMTINGTRANNNYSGLSLLLLCFCVTIYFVYCRLSARIAWKKNITMNLCCIFHRTEDLARILEDDRRRFDVFIPWRCARVMMKRRNKHDISLWTRTIWIENSPLIMLDDQFAETESGKDKQRLNW